MKLFLFFLISLTLFNLKLAGLDLTITQGTIKPTPIAITDFYSKNNQSYKIGKNISKVISDNLERSGLFLPIDRNAFIQNNEDLSKQIRFEDWKVIKSQYLISGSVQINSNEQIIVCYKLFDIFSQKWKKVKIKKVDKAFFEHNYLKLNSLKAKEKFGWKPLYSTNEAIHSTIEWYKENENEKKNISKTQLIKYLNL